ncbi:hypothetical protein B0H13DRAFT_39503 [Mycena leptocephala]|nr:hypothetical protein B0H13DRAFT_39503 [Mycena leptocephala]
MKALSLLVLLFSVASTQAAVNGPCTVSGLATGTGVCISKSKCTAKGGTVHNGLCPNDPHDIKCCTKSFCGSAASGGVCRFDSSCTGNHNILGNQCPGPNDFQCCVPCVRRKRDEDSGELDKRIPICT